MVRVLVYIFTIISAAADVGPDKMMCFFAGLHYLLTFPTRMSKISQKSMCFYVNFSEKGCLHIAIYANFCKRENVCRPAGKHISPRPSSAKEITGNCLPVSQRLILVKNHLSKSNLDMFALEANMLFLLFRSCSNRVKPRQLEPWYIKAPAYIE